MFRDLISKEEYKMIEYLRKNYTVRSQPKGQFMSNYDWLSYWADEKSRFFLNIFKDTLILKKRISLANFIDYEVYKNIDHLLCFDFTEFQNIIKAKLFEMEDEGHFGYKNDQDPKSRYLSATNHFLAAAFATDVWVENIYKGPDFIITKPDGKTFTISHNCKLMKMLQKVMKVMNLGDQFEPYRLRQSQILNQAALRDATLCLSIHPLDYMTASYNNNNWESCMNWENGCYRRGVIEMMNSAYVVVAYIESDDTSLMFWTGNGYSHWNSKKWREFFIVSPEILLGIKGYPYWNKPMEREVLEWLRELMAPEFKKIYNAEFAPKVMEFQYDAYDTETHKNFPLKGINTERQYDITCGPAMYNDFYGPNLYQYIPSTVFDDNAEDGTFYLDYSGKSICVICGYEDGYASFDGEGHLACCDCDPATVCTSCGEYIYDEDDIYWVNGEPYCYDCWSNMSTCDWCDTTLAPEDDYVFGVYDDKHSDDKHLKIFSPYAPNLAGNSISICHYCDHCRKAIFKSDYKDDAQVYEKYTDHYGYVPVYPISVLKEEFIQFMRDNNCRLDKHYRVQYDIISRDDMNNMNYLTMWNSRVVCPYMSYAENAPF